MTKGILLKRALTAAAFLGLAAGAQAQIRVAGVGANDGNACASQIFSSGDLEGSFTPVATAEFNAMSVAELRANFEVLIFTWVSDPAVNADWSTRLLPYMALGGGIIFEDPGNISDLAPGVTAVESNTSAAGLVVSASVPGLTDGIRGSFVNNHIRFTAWDSALSPFLHLGGNVVGLWGSFPGGGRIVLTGPDQHFHGERGAPDPDGNQYDLLLNEVRFVAGLGACELDPASPSICARVLDAAARPVRALHVEEGWPAPNPLNVEVKVNNPLADFYATDINLVLHSSAPLKARFWVFSGPEACRFMVEVEKYRESNDYSYVRYNTFCPVVLLPGETRTLNWGVWVQPWVAGSLEVSARLIDRTTETEIDVSAVKVQVPEASSIHPVLFLPGILGTMPPDEQEGVMDPFLGIYDPLLQNLQKMGYEYGITLRPMPYDWLNSNRVSADRLKELIDNTVSTTEGLAYASQDGKVDLVVHSMGGLVTRAYVQGLAVDDENGNVPIPYEGDIRKVVFIASPHRGFPVDYRTWEGNTWDMYLSGALRTGMNHILWPAFVKKRWMKAHPGEPVPRRCTPAPKGPPACVDDTYRMSHDPLGGVVSLREMLPTVDAGPYLFAVEDGSTEPYGRQDNNLLDELNAGVQVLADRIGGENLYVVYGYDTETEFQYAVTEPPKRGRERGMWANGRPGDTSRDRGGDDLIPTYSTNLKLLLPEIPSDNVVALPGEAARHKEIMFHPDTQTKVSAFLTGLVVPFTTPREGLPESPPFGILKALCPVNLTMTDPLGRRAGYDPETGGVFREIPGAIYAAPGAEGQFIVLPSARRGNYEVTATAFDDGDFTLLLQHVDHRGVSPKKDVRGQARKGETFTYTVEYNPDRSEDRPPARREPR